MSSEKIVLPGFLIADLYKNHLVDLNIHAALSNEVAETVSGLTGTPLLPAETKIKFAGGNARNVIVVVDQAQQEFLAKDDMDFLTNILKACSCTLDDIAIVNVAGQLPGYSAIKEQLNGVYFLLFNIDPAAIKLPFVIPLFQVQNYDGCIILPAPALSEINQANPEGRLLKTKLWVSLKKVFNISG